MARPFLKEQVWRALIRFWRGFWQGEWPVGDGLPWQKPGWRVALSLHWCHVALFASLRGDGQCLGQGRRLIAPPDCGAPSMTCRAHGAPPPPRPILGLSWASSPHPKGTRQGPPSHLGDELPRVRHAATVVPGKPELRCDWLRPLTASTWPDTCPLGCQKQRVTWPPCKPGVRANRMWSGGPLAESRRRD